MFAEPPAATGTRAHEAPRHDICFARLLGEATELETQLRGLMKTDKQPVKLGVSVQKGRVDVSSTGRLSR